MRRMCVVMSPRYEFIPASQMGEGMEWALATWQPKTALEPGVVYINRDHPVIIFGVFANIDPVAAFTLPWQLHGLHDLRRQLAKSIEDRLGDAPLRAETLRELSAPFFVIGPVRQRA